MVKIRTNMTADDAQSFVITYHKKNPVKTFLQVIGECKVSYHGRAQSFLDWGERIIMIKQDGNLLVHQPVLREPINWQPAGSITDFISRDDVFIIKSRHTKPDEKMKITFRRINSILIDSLKDQAELDIVGMESDVVNQILESPEVIEHGLRIKKREKQVKSGMIDLYGLDKEHTPVIIEVKRSLATISAVHQLRMYVQDVKHDVDEADVRGILCAPRVPDMVKHLLDDYGLEWQEIERSIVLADDMQKTLKEFG
ncbi:MAG: endonuclease NucS [Thermoplasmatota archaeon]